MRIIFAISMLFISIAYGGVMLEVFLEQYAKDNGLAYISQLPFSMLASAIIHGIAGACWMLCAEEFKYRDEVRKHESEN